MSKAVETIFKPKGGSGPSRLDADGWRKMLTANIFGNCTIDPHKVLTDSSKHICLNEAEMKDNKSSLESFSAHIPIPLVKNPTFKLIGFGEVLI